MPPFKTTHLILIQLPLYAFVLTVTLPALRPGLLLHSSTFLNLTLPDNPHDNLASLNAKPLPPAPFDLHFTGGIVKIIDFMIPISAPDTVSVLRAALIDSTRHGPKERIEGRTKEYTKGTVWMDLDLDPEIKMVWAYWGRVATELLHFFREYQYVGLVFEMFDSEGGKLGTASIGNAFSGALHKDRI